MAKAKKDKSTESTAPKSEAAPAKKAPKAKKPAAAPAIPPLIDTGLAAAAAARFVANKDVLDTGAPSSGESSSFKHLKDQVNNPNVPAFLQNIAPTKKFGAGGHKFNQQVGRNQTFGADVNRTGVPRRTGG